MACCTVQSQHFGYCVIKAIVNITQGIRLQIKIEINLLGLKKFPLKQNTLVPVSVEGENLLSLTQK
jgi:hypothetical protein